MKKINEIISEVKMKFAGGFVYNQKIEELAQEARTANTNEELATICLKLNIADLVSLDKIDLWFAKLALSTIYRTLKKFPLLRKKINFFGTLHGFEKDKEYLFAKLNKGADNECKRIVKNLTYDIAENCRTHFKNNGLALAFYVDGTFGFSGIIINHKDFGSNESGVLKNLEYAEKIGHSPKGCNSIKSIIDHEVGHILDFMLKISKSNDFSAFIKKYDLKQIESELSKYCVKNNTVAYSEVIAEGYSEYCNNKKPREIALGVEKIIETKYEEYEN